MGNRIHSIDTLRSIAIFFVVIAHVRPFHGYEPYGNHVYFFLDTIGQFDVPFFFLTAGYFLAKKTDTERLASVARGSIRKLGSMYLFGTLVALGATAIVAAVRGRVVARALGTRLHGALAPFDLLYYGNAIAAPLWFLPALAFSICFVLAFVAASKARYLLPVAACAHVVGLVDQTVGGVPFMTRDAVFFGFFYVALGFHLRSADWAPDRSRGRTYLGLVGVLLVVQLLEQYAIGYGFRDLTLARGVHTTQFSVTTVFLTVAVFAYALSNPGLGEGTPLPALGEYAVGVYLVHAPLFHALRALTGAATTVTGFDISSPLAWHVVLAPLVYALSIAVYLLAAKTGLVEIGGSHVPRLGRIRMRLRTVAPGGDAVSE